MPHYLLVRAPLLPDVRPRSLQDSVNRVRSRTFGSQFESCDALT